MYSIITLFRGLIQGLLVFLNRILGQNTASLVEFGHDGQPHWHPAILIEIAIC